MIEKNFDSWNILKQKLNKHEKLPTYKEREIWWCSIGVNVGHEEDGKSEIFSRPVLVLRKFNSHIFIGIPLTSVNKDNKYYFPITFKDKSSCLMLSQLRVFESKRLTRMKGKLSDKQFSNVRKVMSDIILGVYPTPHC
jgi:mRNA interferase MazF